MKLNQSTRNLPASPDMSEKCQMSGKGVNFRQTLCLGRGNLAKCPAKKWYPAGHFKSVFKNLRQRYVKSPAKSQNVRRGTHGSPDKMSGEALKHFAYSGLTITFACLSAMKKISVRSVEDHLNFRYDLLVEVTYCAAASYSIDFKI